MKLDFDVIVIGAGLGGLLASFYLEAREKSCLLLEKEIPGGQLNEISLMEGYPIVGEMSGSHLAEELLNQAQEMGVCYRYGDVKEIRNLGDYKEVVTSQEVISCKYVLLAMGSRPMLLGLDNEKQLLDRGIHYAFDGNEAFYMNKEVAIVGNSEEAVLGAIRLANLAKEVHLIASTEDLMVAPYLKKRLKTKENVSVSYCTEIRQLLEEESHLMGLRLVNRRANEEKILPVEGCFVFIGRVPNSECALSLGITDEEGSILVDTHNETKIRNIFAVGDVVKKEDYQLETILSDCAVASRAIVYRNN